MMNDGSDVWDTPKTMTQVGEDNYKNWSEKAYDYVTGLE